MSKILWVIARSQWDRLTAMVVALVALIAVALGWLGVANTSYLAEQIPYVVSGGILAVILMALAATLWLSADMRDEWRKLDQLGEKLDAISQSIEAVSIPAPDGETVNGSGPKRRTSRRVASES
jgi:type VI protein secretion system component VasK